MRILKSQSNNTLDMTSILDKHIRSLPHPPDLTYDIGRGKVDGKPTITLHHIEVKEDSRGQGIASKFLKDLTTMADQLGVTIDLDVGPDEAEIGLVDWYTRHGFTFSAGGNFMIRYPNE